MALKVMRRIVHISCIFDTEPVDLLQHRSYMTNGGSSVNDAGGTQYHVSVRRLC